MCAHGYIRVAAGRLHVQGEDGDFVFHDVSCNESTVSGWKSADR